MKITFIQCFRVANASISRLDWSLQSGITAPSIEKYMDKQITFILSEQTLHRQLCLQFARGNRGLNVQSNRKSICWMKRNWFLLILSNFRRPTDFISNKHLLLSIHNNRSSQSNANMFHIQKVASKSCFTLLWLFARIHENAVMAHISIFILETSTVINIVESPSWWEYVVTDADES